MVPNNLNCRRFPNSQTIGQFLALVGESLYDMFADELVILAMGADPKPMDAAWHWKPKCPVIEADSDAVKSTVSNGLEMQRWMVWIDFELREISVRNGLNFGGQCVKALPKTL